MKNDQKTTDKAARKKIHGSLSGIFANQDKIICLASRENTQKGITTLLERGNFLSMKS
jgi:hypothetical protein